MIIQRGESRVKYSMFLSSPGWQQNYQLLSGFVNQKKKKDYCSRLDEQ